MNRELPTRRAKINPENGFVVSECPKTKRPVFTHVENGCLNCENHNGSTENTLICNYGEEPNIHEALANAREILKRIKDRANDGDEK